MQIPKQSYNLWERGETLPTVESITLISNFLHICPLFFFIDGEAEIEFYDLIYSAKNGFHLQFTPTHVSIQISKILNRAIKHTALYLVEIPGGNGTTRAIYEWQKKTQNQSLVIYDNLHESQLDSFLDLVETLPDTSIIIFATPPVIRKLKKEIKLAYIFIEMDSICYHEFLDIIHTALPSASIEIKTLILTETCFSLPKLSLLIKKLAQARMENGWEMNFDSIMDLCEKIKVAESISSRGSKNE